MRRYASEEIIATLERIDRFLSKRCDVIVIGGAAIAVRHDSLHITSDIDLFQVPKDFMDAYKALCDSSPAVVPVEAAAIADAPYDFEDRLIALALDARFLNAWTPERHDLVMMKTVRGYDHNLQGIEDVHRTCPLDLETLVSRYREMGHAVGSAVRLRGNFLAVVARLWGEDVAGDLDLRLPTTREPGCD